MATAQTLDAQAVKERAGAAFSACANAAEQIKSCVASCQSIAKEIELAGDQLAADFTRRATAFSMLIEQFAQLHERHHGLVVQLRQELDALDAPEQSNVIR